jgi:hypothetical protein
MNNFHGFNSPSGDRSAALSVPDSHPNLLFDIAQLKTIT